MIKGITIFVVIFVIVIANIANKEAKRKNQNQNAGKPQGTPGAGPQNINTQYVTNNINKTNYTAANKYNCGVEHHRFDENRHPTLEEGRGITAMRYEEWMPVRKGDKVVKCCYCGADNEIPLNARGDFKCYFCWKHL